MEPHRFLSKELQSNGQRIPLTIPRSPGTRIVGAWVTDSIKLYRDLRTGTQYIGNWGVPVLKSVYNFIISVTQGPTIWVPGLLGNDLQQSYASTPPSWMRNKSHRRLHSVMVGKDHQDISYN